jgi:hypothetical protein
MNWKRYGIGVVTSYIVLMLLGFLLHGKLLAPVYKTAAPGLLRSDPEFMARFHFLALGYLVFALAAVWIYAYGVENKPWPAQGVRYGIALWVLASLMPTMVGYAIQPWPGDILVKGSAADLVMMVVAGVTIAAVYRKSAGIPRSSRAAA